MDYYDSISQGYDELYGEEQLRKAELIAKHMKPRSSDYLLDVGCGSASYFPLFSCIRIGVDPSLELLKKASEADEGSFIQAAAENLPFKDGSFDYVISITAIHNFTSPKKCLMEIRRVAKNLVILSVLKQARKFEEISKLIRELFTIKNLILEEKDLIFVLHSKI